MIHIIKASASLRTPVGETPTPGALNQLVYSQIRLPVLAAADLVAVVNDGGNKAWEVYFVKDCANGPSFGSFIRLAKRIAAVLDQRTH